MSRVQLSAALPAGGATVPLTSSNPGLAPVPATIAMPGGFALHSFEIPIGQVTSPTPVTLSATLNGTTASSQFTVLPPTLNDDPLQSGALIATGGATMTGYVDLEGVRLCRRRGRHRQPLDQLIRRPPCPRRSPFPAGPAAPRFPIQTSPVADGHDGHDHGRATWRDDARGRSS